MLRVSNIAEKNCLSDIAMEYGILLRNNVRMKNIL
jgi:hypothetical protein